MVLRRTLFGLGLGWLMAAGTASAQLLLPAPVVRIPPEQAKPAAIPPATTPAPPPAAMLPPLLDVTKAPVDETPPAALKPLPPVPSTNSVESLCSPPRCEPNLRNRGYANFEFLYWATQGVTLPPLLTTGTGVLGYPFTEVEFGGFRTLNGMRPGFRVEAGYWCDDCEQFGVSGRFYFLGRQAEGVAGGSDGSQLLALPVQLASPGWLPNPQPYPAPPPYLLTPINVQPLPPPYGVPLNQAVLVGLPGQIKGTVDINTGTNFLGFNLDARHCMTHTEYGRLEFFGGYRYMFLGDSLNQSFDAVTIDSSGALTGSRLMGNDSWRSRNYFHGAEFGMHVTRDCGPYSITLETALAMGVTRANLDTNQTRTSGSLGQQDSIYQVGGSDRTSYFGVVPEVGLKLGWSPTDHVRLTGGYNFLYWNRVRRAQTQYDLTPVTVNDPVDFWAQGWNLGVEVRY